MQKTLIACFGAGLLFTASVTLNFSAKASSLEEALAEVEQLKSQVDTLKKENAQIRKQNTAQMAVHVSHSTIF